MRTEEYKTHPLSKIFYFLGVLTIGASVIWSILLLANDAENLVPFVLFGGFLNALFLVAFGAIIDLLSKNEYNTRQLNKTALLTLREEAKQTEHLARMAGEGADEEADFEIGDLSRF